ncbi:hypothetical protein HDU76_006766 [Blyttiomyces sp. JEL0837]|nr:hypothetical protein HDU76_006766 [Blyttiomyces sp. JEL0837]
MDSRGIVGMSCARLGAKVTLTDVEAALDSLNGIVKINELQIGQSWDGHDQSSATGFIENVVALDWTDRTACSKINDGRPFDVIVAADVVWVYELIAPLVETIRELIKPNCANFAVLAHQTRSMRGDEAFFKNLKDRGLSWEVVDESLLDTMYRRDNVNVYIIADIQ